MKTRSDEFKVVRVESNEVEVRFRDIFLVFKRYNKRIHLVSKTNLYKQIYDPESLWIDRQDFSQICRKVAKIMDDKSLSKRFPKKASPKEWPLQLSLFNF